MGQKFASAWSTRGVLDACQWFHDTYQFEFNVDSEVEVETHLKWLFVQIKVPRQAKVWDLPGKEIRLK